MEKTAYGIQNNSPTAKRSDCQIWCRHQESNSGPPDYKSGALPTELYRHMGLYYCTISKNGAGTKSRTRDPLITSQVLYQLSYTGKELHIMHTTCQIGKTFVLKYAQNYNNYIILNKIILKQNKQRHSDKISAFQTDCSHRWQDIPTAASVLQNPAFPKSAFPKKAISVRFTWAATPSKAQ